MKIIFKCISSNNNDTHANKFTHPHDHTMENYASKI